jgi:endonuclease/exonuclease/phosphatase family metal-dependent hydrolase
MPNNPVTRQFYFKRAILEARFPVENGKDFAALNTHFDAWSEGAETMALQTACAQAQLERLDLASCAWCLGGDFNLLPPGSASPRLSPSERARYNKTSELTPLFARYRAMPDASETDGAHFERFLTHFPNGKLEPDRTIDYIFVSPRLELCDHHIRQRDPGQADFLKISDHFPLVVEITLP